MPMPIPTRAWRRFPLVLLLTAAPAALAQSPYGATVQSLSQPGDPAELLAQALRTLAVEPSNLSALTTAGHNALVLGDPNAAVGFFGRAQEIAPRDGRVKAGLGSALVELEKPQDALRLFAEAERLGVPETEFAEDRGLAYDLTGDPRRAQRDYGVVLAAHPDDDLVRRRLALSQGISGDKTTAIATLDPLIRKRDIAGWRAQTFVLAMNGDAAGASAITHIMLPQQAEMLQPFLVRLATLSPADKARAVNFGEMPAAGRAYTPSELANTGGMPTYAATSSPARVAPAPRVAARASDLAPVPTPIPRATIAAPIPRVATIAPTSAAPNPVAITAAPLAGIALTPAAPQVATQILPTPPRATPPAAPLPSASTAELPTPAPVGHYDLPHDTVHAAARPVAIATTTRTVGTPVVHGRTAKAAPVVVAAAEPESVRTRAAAEDASANRSSPAHVGDGPADDIAPGRHGKAKSSPAPNDASEPVAENRKAGHAKRAAIDETDDAAATKQDRAAAHGRLAAADGSDAATPGRGRKGAHGKSGPAEDGDAGSKTRKGAHGTRLAADEPDDAKAKKGTHGKASSEDDGDARSSKSAKKESGKAQPERVFVQVAGGANKDDMDKAWAGVKKKAPELMKGRTPQTAPVHATNRLLVGPFKSEDEAQAFVNKMAGKGLSGFTVKTGKGEKVEKVDGGQ